MNVLQRELVLFYAHQALTRIVCPEARLSTMQQVGDERFLNLYRRLAGEPNITDVCSVIQAELATMADFMRKNGSQMSPDQIDPMVITYGSLSSLLMRFRDRERRQQPEKACA